MYVVGGYFLRFEPTRKRTAVHILYRLRPNIKFRIMPANLDRIRFDEIKVPLCV